MVHFSVEVHPNSIVTLLHQVVDHALQAERSAVVRTVDTGDAIVVQFRDLFRQNGTATTTKNLDVTGPFFLEQVVHVFEVLHMPALVGGHGNSVGVFLDGTIHHLFHTAVVTQVDHFHPGGLDDAPHDIDGSVMPVEQAGRGHDAYLMGRVVRGNFLHT